MNTTELRLFEFNESKNQIVNKFEDNDSQVNTYGRLSVTETPLRPDILSKALNSIFYEQEHTDKQIKKAKEVLGKTADALTKEQLSDIVAEIQYLAECWLDEYERNIFSGLTLRELLHEKGSL